MPSNPQVPFSLADAPIGLTNDPVFDRSQQPLADPRHLMKIGFFFALGVVLLLVVAAFARVVLTATASILTPFILGGAIALLLDPLVERIQRLSRFSRTPAAVMTFGVVIFLIIALVSFVLPKLSAQAQQLAKHFPLYLDQLRGQVTTLLHRYPRIASVKMPKDYNALLAQLGSRASALLQRSFGTITALLIGSVTLLVQLALSLVIALFLLIDLKRLRARLMFLAPSRWRKPMKTISSDIGGVFSDYVRGLLIVCALYGVGTTLLLYGLSMVHHSLAQYALLIGTLAGVLYAVPYLGAITTSGLIFAIGVVSSGNAAFGAVAIASSIALNQIFDNIITPKVVGGGVGLHPVVALFALVLGGEMFGIWGMVLSVPVAASIQVILFHIFPRTTTPTPQHFLTAQGVPPDEAESIKVTAGEDSVTEKRQAAEKEAPADTVRSP